MKASHLRRKFNNDEDVRRIIYLCMSLPFLSSETIPEGFTLIEMEAATAPPNVALGSFIEYIRDYWVGRRGQEMSVYGQRHRTNNCLESSFRVLNDMCRHPHPNVVKFTSK